MRTTTLIVTLGLCACGSDPVEGDESSSTSGTTSTTSTTTATTATTEPATTSSASTGMVDSSDGGSSSGAVDSGGSSDTAPGTCDFPSAVADAAAGSDPTDCGSLTADDPLIAWTDARACARDAQLHTQAFQLVWQIDDAGTIRDRAFVSKGGGAQLAYLEDDDAKTTTSITITNCTGTGNPPGCEVAVGEMCLECLMPTVAIELCE